MDTNLADIQDALKTAIDAQASGCTVSLGYPVGGPGDRNIWVSGAPNVIVTRELSAFEQREERLEQDVYCQATLSGNSYTDARDACLVLVGYVEAALAADRTLGGLVRSAWVDAIGMDEAIPEERRRQVAATIRIAIEGTVT